VATHDALRQGRASYQREAWRDAHAFWSAADREVPLEPEDLDGLAACAYMLGNESECADLWSRAHHAFLQRGDADQAARCAFRIGRELLSKGMSAQGSGWLARARRVLRHDVEQHLREVIKLSDAEIQQSFEYALADPETFDLGRTLAAAERKESAPTRSI